jgi:hypothetical protein
MVCLAPILRVRKLLEGISYNEAAGPEKASRVLLSDFFFPSWRWGFLQQRSIIVCPNFIFAPGLVIPCFFADYLKVLECRFFVRRQMPQVALRIAIFYHGRLDSMCGTIGRHDCVKDGNK